MKPKYTSQSKNKITMEWNDLFPEMGRYKSMWLMNIVGPIAVGIILQVKGDKTIYEPSLHLHDLGSNTDFVSLTGEISADFDYVSTISAPDKYIKLANKLKAKAIIPLSGDLTFEEIKICLCEYYRKCISEEKYDFLVMYLRVAIWAGNEDEIEKAYNLLKTKFKYKNIDKLLEPAETLKERVEKNIMNLKLNKLPRREII